jgi:hypothetical protein
VPEHPGRARLVHESLDRRFVAGELGFQELERDLPAHDHVACDVDLGHPPGGEQVLDLVATLEHCPSGQRLRWLVTRIGGHGIISYYDLGAEGQSAATR